MSFGGGGGGALPNHEHTNIALDGGPLDFVNTTIASMNAGSTTFSDGNALQELVIGTPAQSLVVNGLGTAPEWITPAAGGPTTAQYIATGASFSTSSVTFVDVTNMTITLPNTGGTLDCLCNVFMSGEIAVAADMLMWRLVKDTTALVYSEFWLTGAAEGLKAGAMSCLCDGDGDPCKLQMQTFGNTGTFRVSATEQTPCLSAFAVG